MNFLIKLVILIMLSNPMSLSNKGNLHTLKGYVYYIDNEYIYIDTDDGNGWVLENDGFMQVGNKLSIVFSDMGTPDDIYDDEIIKIDITNFESQTR